MSELPGYCPLSDLPLSDLLALHTNYFASDGHGARYLILNEDQFVAVEIAKRIAAIDFKETIKKINHE